MNRIVCVAVVVVALLVGSQAALAALYQVALSPPASQALNLGTETYPGDHGPQLSPLNESSQPNSTASGGVLTGISYDDVTRLLALDFGYGDAFGFNDLVSDWNGGVHIHGNGTNTAQFPDLNTNAGVIYNLGGFHVAAGPRAGRVTGAVTLSEEHEGWLFNNQLYINVHTEAFPGGEIRGQLVPVIPEPVTLGLALVAGLPLLVLRRRRQ